MLATLHEVYDPKTMPQRSNRDPFHVAYSRILRSGAGEFATIPEAQRSNQQEDGLRGEQFGLAKAIQTYASEIADVKERFETTLHQYVREVCAPMLGAGPDDLVYQRSPTLRVSVPGIHDKAMGRPHRDYDYFHQTGEVNFWMPCTEVFGTNSLYTESAVGRGDFHPLVLGYGKCVRFWGNQAWHYCVPNQEMTTRVSLDFRVIVKGRFNHEFRDVNDNVARFNIGEFYRDSAETST